MATALLVAYRRIGIYADNISLRWRHLQDLLTSLNPKVDQALFRFAQCLDQIVMGKLWNLVRFLDDQAFSIDVKRERLASFQLGPAVK